jgi:hypothetical protein
MTTKINPFKINSVEGGGTFLQAIYLIKWPHIAEGSNHETVLTFEQSRVCPLVLSVVQIHYNFI